MFRLTQENNLFPSHPAVSPPDARGAVQAETIAGNLLFLPDKLAGDKMNILVQEKMRIVDRIKDWDSNEERSFGMRKQ